MKKIILFLLISLRVILTYAQSDTAFWFAAPEVSSVFGYDNPITFKISSYFQPCIVTISQPANGGLAIQTISLPPNTTKSVDLTTWLSSIECYPGNVVQNRGIKITSTEKIAAYYEVNGTGPNPEMFALKGRNALGTEFYISSQYLLNNTSSYSILPYSSFNIVASENNTTVTILPTKNIIGHAANSPFVITLNKGQTYAAIATSQAASQHLQGSHVSADKPIAITLSDDLLFGNVYGGVCSDLAGDQTVPVNVVGKEYIAFKHNLNAPYDKLYITATQNSTTVSQDGATITTINTGQSVELTISSNTTYIQTSAPAYVYQLTGIGCEVGSAILPKINCTGSSSVSVARSTNEPFVITLLVKNGGQTNFLINNASGIITGAQFTVVPGTGGLWYAAKINLPLSNYPNGSIVKINNTTNLFQLGILQGGVLSGGSFGYFSDFNSVRANANTSNNKPCESSSVQLFADSIVSSSYNWTGPNNFTSNLQNPKINNLSTVNSGNYILKVSVPGCGLYDDTVNINVIPKDALIITTTLCQGENYEGYTNTGTYIDTLASGSGCGTIRTINLTVKPKSTTTIYQTICQGQNYAGHTISGTYIDTLVSDNGCDSIRTLYLTVRPTSASSIAINQTICEGQNYLGYTASGTYADTLVAANGCDSIRTIHLLVNARSTITLNQTICEGQNYLGYTMGGKYIDTLNTANGCDSIRTIYLTVNTKILTTITQTICNGETYFGHTSSGIYIDTLTGANGCDSIRTLYLSVKPVLPSNITQTICQGETYAGYSKSGTYIDTLAATNGCDSIRTIKLLVNPIPLTNIDQTICQGQEFLGYSVSGTYIDTFIAANGCDSLRTLKLIVENRPAPELGPDRILCSDTLMLNPGSFSSYLWQNGSTQNYFIVRQPGPYSVVVTNTCGSVKDETTISEGICEVLFPNAFTPGNAGGNNTFKILNSYNLSDFYLAIYNRWGEKVFETRDYSRGWDGTKNNKPADMGNYVWYCKFTKSGIEKHLKGSLLLIR